MLVFFDCCIFRILSVIGLHIEQPAFPLLDIKRRKSYIKNGAIIALSFMSPLRVRISISLTQCQRKNKLNGLLVSWSSGRGWDWVAIFLLHGPVCIPAPLCINKFSLYSIKKISVRLSTNFNGVIQQLNTLISTNFQLEQSLS